MGGPDGVTRPKDLLHSEWGERTRPSQSARTAASELPARRIRTMIHYALRCGNAHEFDGWFRSSASFDQQAAGLLLDCPVCGHAPACGAR